MTGWIRTMSSKLSRPTQADDRTPIRRPARLVTGPAATPSVSGSRQKRRFRRYPVRVPMRAAARGRALTGITTSLGLGGTFLPCADAPPLGCTVTIHLGDSDTMGTVVAHGRVAYRHTAGMGIRFTGLTATDVRRLNQLLQAAPREPVPMG